MDKTIKGQTATEFIIILAVVLISAMIIIHAILSNNTSTTSVISKSDLISLEQQNIGISDFAIGEDGIRLELTNHFAYDITITHVIVNNTYLASTNLSMRLSPYETRVLFSNSTNLTAGEGYNVPIVINYTDSQLNKARLQNNTGLPLKGIAISKN